MAVIATLYVAVAAPLLALYRERDGELATRRMLDHHLRAAAATVPMLESEVGSLRQLAKTQKITIDGSSDALAAAGLQSHIERLAAADAITIASIEGLPAEIRRIYRRIGLRMAVSGTYDSLVRFLAALENATPPLVLDNLQIHTERRVLGSDAFGQLRASLEVYGFRSNDAALPLKP